MLTALWIVAVAAQLIRWMWLKPSTDSIADATWNACVNPGGQS